MIKRHPAWGTQLLASSAVSRRPCGALVHDHHERLDGIGYPDGLTADQIDLDTRILAVCDVYDALVS